MPIVQDLIDSLEKIKELHKRKNDDYADSNNPFSNFDVSEYGLRLFTNPRDQSFIWPIFTKFARLSTLCNSGKLPNNESIEDSLLDIATYVLLWKADLKNRSGNRCTSYYNKGNMSFQCQGDKDHVLPHEFYIAGVTYTWNNDNESITEAQLDPQSQKPLTTKEPEK